MNQKEIYMIFNKLNREEPTWFSIDEREFIKNSLQELSQLRVRLSRTEPIVQALKDKKLELESVDDSIKPNVFVVLEVIKSILASSDKNTSSEVKQ